MKLSPLQQKILGLGIIFLLWLAARYLEGNHSSHTEKKLVNPSTPVSKVLPPGELPKSFEHPTLDEKLPPEVGKTLSLIKRGGPFPFSQDGVVFFNRERKLPQKEKGYYREYTVITPELRHRGARRLIIGRAGEIYYTKDHYRTFAKLQPP